MNLAKLMILLMILISTNSFGQAQKIKVGERATFDGVLITEKQLQEYDTAERANRVLKELSSLQDMRIEQYRKDLKEAKSEINKVAFKGYLGTAGGFVLGVLITGFAAKAAIEATR